MSDDQPVLTDQRRYPHGVPSWVDVGQTDLEASRAFYGGLFGWEATNVAPAGGSDAYFVATLDGHDVAGLAPVDAAAECRWRTYVAVHDGDATAAAVTQHGGTVVRAPGDGGPGGRDATCADPQGAEFRLWQARRRLGVQIANSPGQAVKPGSMGRPVPGYRVRPRRPAPSRRPRHGCHALVLRAGWPVDLLALAGLTRADVLAANRLRAVDHVDIPPERRRDLIDGLLEMLGRHVVRPVLDVLDPLDEVAAETARPS